MATPRSHPPFLDNLPHFALPYFSSKYSNIFRPPPPLPPISINFLGGGVRTMTILCTETFGFEIWQIDDIIKFLRFNNHKTKLMLAKHWNISQYWYIQS